VIAPAAPARMGTVGESSWVRTRTRAALLLVLLYAAASTARWVQRGAEWPASSAQDEISAYERRFQAARSMIPARGTVGYLGSPEPTGATPSEANAAALLHFRRYLLAQYALAPVLLVENTDPEFVIGNFEVGVLPTAPGGFRVARDFGNGVVLFRRAKP
jgi:hypothetical protein